MIKFRLPYAQTEYYTLYEIITDPIFDYHSGQLEALEQENVRLKKIVGLIVQHLPESTQVKIASDLGYAAEED